MQIIINGEMHKIIDGCTVSTLLQQLEIDSRQIALEYNGDIIPRSRYEIIALNEGDKLELVEFVGGG